MANKRIYDDVDGMLFNALPVGGITSIQTNQSFVHNIDSIADGSDFPDDIDQAGQQISFSMQTTDVQQGIPLLISTPGTAVWFGHESGAATYGKSTLALPVCHSMSFSASLGQYATVGINGQCRFGASADTFDDVEKYDDAIAAATVAALLRHPLRLWQPRTCLHGIVAIGHVQAISFGVNGRLLTDYDAGDIGTVAVDVAGYQASTISLTIRDVSKQTTTHDLATSLILAGVKDLAITFEGVGDGVDKVLTLRNCKFRTRAKASGRDWTGWTLTGVLQGRDPTGGVIRTIDHATPATRLIDFA